MPASLIVWPGFSASYWKNLTVFKIINGGCLRVCFNIVSIFYFTFGFFQAFFSFVLSLFSLFNSRGCFGITTATFPVFGIRAFLSFLFIVFPTFFFVFLFFYFFHISILIVNMYLLSAMKTLSTVYNLEIIFAYK